MTEPFIGQIQTFGFNFPPKGWALCEGQQMPINTNQALFSLLGTMYGGNGTTTFALPDLRGRAAIGFGQSPGTSFYQQGQSGGNENTILTILQMPQHNHAFIPTGGGSSVMVSSLPGTTPTPSATENTLGALNDPNVSATNNAYNNEAPDITLNTGSGGGGGVIGTNGGSQPFSIMQPYLAINYSIALVGIFPSRN